MNGKARTMSGGNFRFADFMVVIIFLSIAVYSLNLFRLDLFQTLDSRNEDPVGFIVIKNNTVQRRMTDRVLWDRLAVKSPVYLGDLIRVADLSSTTLDIDNSHIALNENTLIRIQRARGGEGPIQIELSAGSLDLTTGEGGEGLMLNIMGRQIQAGSGTALNVSAGADGMVLQVNEGTAQFVEEGNRREISSGRMIALDSSGAERMDKAAMVTRPRSNARYLKSGPEPYPVNFAWNRINFEPGETLRLEIASDRNFAHIHRTIGGLSAGTETALGAGSWHWRLSFGDNALSSGRFTITEAAGPQLISPVKERIFHYQDSLPELRFEWSAIEEASQYVLEASQTPDFINPRLNVQAPVNYLVYSGLGPGTWYWRVLPVFPSAWEGSASFSSANIFYIEQGGRPEELVRLPEPEPEPEPEPVPPELRLTSPAAGERLPGLSALRQQTLFYWDCDAEVEKSRFILSANPNPFRGRPLVEIKNPGRIIRLDRLGEGVWYWTVEAQTSDGFTVSAAEPRQLQVLPIPLLNTPGNRLPLNGHRIGIEELRAQRSIDFRWSAVPGANAYIFTLYQGSPDGRTGGRRQIIRIGPENRTRWTLDDLNLLDRGTFYWQVEAVNRNPGGTIEQRGTVGENSFFVNIPLTRPVVVEEPGILYGN